MLLRAAVFAPFLIPADDVGREPDGCFAPRLDAVFLPEAADFLTVARDGFFAAVLERVFVVAFRGVVVDADRVFAADAVFRGRTDAVGLRAGEAAAARRGLVATLEVVAAFESRSRRGLALEGVLGDADGLRGEAPAGAA